MGKGRRKRERQDEFWVATDSLPKTPRHVFYEKLNELLTEAGFDEFVEELCEPFYADGCGRPSIPPGVYFRMLFIGYFEGIDSQRGIAWRCDDSRSLAAFLGYGRYEATPDHSSLTNTRKRLPIPIYGDVFCFVLKMVEDHRLLSGKTVAVDATTLEANAAMKSIVRKETGEDWKEYVSRLAEEDGVEIENDEDLRRFDKNRKNKKVPNSQWESPTDTDSRIAKMKDGRTHLAYKAEHVIDLESEVILAAEVYHADRGDTETMLPSLTAAQENLHDVNLCRDIEEAVADKGYHSAGLLEECTWWGTFGLRTYIPEPERKTCWDWTDRSPTQQKAVYGNSRRVKGKRSKRLQRKRSERVERSFAHVCETGGARRTWLRGIDKVNQRYKITAAARNLGLLMRTVFGIGKPRALQGGFSLVYFLQVATQAIRTVLSRIERPLPITNSYNQNGQRFAAAI